MIQRCLEKRPEDRYQSTSDLRRDLEDLKRDVDSGEMVLATTAGRPRASRGRATGRRRWALPVAAGPRWPCSPRSARSAAARAQAGRRRGRPALAGRLLLRQPLRRAAARLAADGSHRHAGHEPLAVARPARARHDRGSISCSTRRATATSATSRRRWSRRCRARRRPRPRSWAASCARGSRIRIQASLQDPQTGEVLASERVEGDAEAGLFALVDELTGRVRRRLETPASWRAGRRRHAEGRRRSSRT